MSGNIFSDVKLQKHRGPGASICSLINSHNSSEHFIVLEPMPGESYKDLLDRSGRVVESLNATIISQDIFGGWPIKKEVLCILHNIFGDITWPVSWMGHRESHEINGIQLWLLDKPSVTPLMIGDDVVANIFENNEFRACRVSNLTSSLASSSLENRFPQPYENIIKTLNMADMDLTDIVRTWFCLDDISVWYSSFNDVRNQVFKQNNVYYEKIPASTAIGNLNGTSDIITANFIAFKGKEANIQKKAIPSPLQSEAMLYGVSFNRAMLIDFSKYQRLYVSGTASIDASGCTIHKGNTIAQALESVRVVEEILRSCDMNWNNVARGTAYCKNPKEIESIRTCLHDYGVSDIPLIITSNIICRNDLLFEIEIDAIKVHGNE